MKLTRPITLATALAVALLGAAVAGVVAHASATTKTITVTEKEFHIGLSAKTAPAGSVRFLVKNVGKYPHALAIAGAGISKKKTAMIMPGKTATLTVTLKSGTYSLWCPVPGHAAKGMKASINVAGSSGGAGGYGAGASTSTGTTTGGGGSAWG